MKAMWCAMTGQENVEGCVECDSIMIGVHDKSISVVSLFVCLWL